MPVHLSTWKVIKRAAAVVQVATVGKEVPGMQRAWGPGGVKEVLQAYKKSDASREHTVTTYAKFNERIGRYYDDPIPKDEWAKLQMFAMEYFQAEDRPKASFVNHPAKSRLKRIEILGSSGWLDLWTDA